MFKHESHRGASDIHLHTTQCDPDRFSQHFTDLLLTQSVLQLESLACGCAGNVLPMLLVFTSVVHA